MITIHVGLYATLKIIMKATIVVPDYIINILRKAYPDITDYKISKVFVNFINHYLEQEEMYSGMSNNFEIWLESDDFEDMNNFLTHFD